MPRRKLLWKIQGRDYRMKIIKTLSLLVALWSGLGPAFAQTWTQTSAPTNEWVSVASSADGSKLAAAAGLANSGDGLIYISTNSGLDWTQTSAPANDWTAVASSADGVKLIAASSGMSNLVFISTNSGLAWMATMAPPDDWQAVAASATGRTLLAAAFGDVVYYSTNCGANWMPGNTPVADWNSVACSANGMTAIAANDGQVWISRDSGATWAQTDLPSYDWSSVCSSADGNKLFAIAPTLPGFGGNGPIPGCVALSTDSGADWTTNGSFSADAIVSSADGSRLTAMNDEPTTNSGIYNSTDLGMTWTEETNFSGPIACSADGEELIVVTYAGFNSFGGGAPTLPLPGPIYISFTTPVPFLNIARANSNLALSWIVPSTNFVLEQSSDLQNWSDLTNQPCLNLTNLLDETTLPMTNSAGFYRLATQ